MCFKYLKPRINNFESVQLHGCVFGEQELTTEEATVLNFAGASCVAKSINATLDFVYAQVHCERIPRGDSTLGSIEQSQVTTNAFSRHSVGK